MNVEVQRIRKITYYVKTKRRSMLVRFTNTIPIPELHSIWTELDKRVQLEVFLSLNMKTKVQLVELLSPAELLDVLLQLPFDNMKDIFENLEPDDLVDIIQILPPEVRTAAWESLSQEARQESQFLLRFDQDDAAGIMTPRYLAFRSTATVQQALQFVRKNATSIRSIYYVYIVDQLRRLKGIISLRTLLATEDHVKIADVMETKILSVREETDQEETVRLLEEYNLLALPVLDIHQRLLGVVSIRDALRVIREEQAKDTYRLGAMEESTDPYLSSSVFKLVRKRVPWLMLLLVAGTATTNLLNFFHPIIASMGFLIWFLPVITQTGGNSSTQSLTLMIQGITQGEIAYRNIISVVLKELLVSLVLGFILGITIFIRGIAFPPGIDLVAALTVGLSLLLVVIFSSLLGAISPLIIHRMGFDPTVMAGPLMSTLIDMVGLSIYFLIAILIFSP